MSAIRLQYDLAHSPYYIALPGDGKPSNTVPSAKVLEIGDSAYPIDMTAGGTAVNIRIKHSAGATDTRALYVRAAAEVSPGANNSIEALRAFTNVNENISNANGAHISLSFDDTAGGSECSGEGYAVKATTHIPNVASWNPTGTLAAMKAEIYSDGAASDPDNLTELSFIRIENAGNATGKADVDTDAFLFSIQGFTSAADVTKVLSSVSLAELPASTVGLRVKIGAGTYYIPAVLSTEWD